MTQQTILLLALGVVLVLGALLAGALRGRAASAPAARALRIVAGLAGAVLIGWLLMPMWQSYRSAPLPAASSAAPAAAPTAPPTSPSPAPPDATAAPAVPRPSPIELVQSASTALNDCAAPTAPRLPDGAKATLPQMNQARQAFQAYDAATNGYTRCVDETVDRVAKQYGATASAEGLKDLKAFGVRAHNAAIDEEQSVAEQLNAQVRTYNAKHPPK